MIGDRQHVDTSARDALALCTCGWRSGPHQTTQRAWQAAHHHAVIAHPGEIAPTVRARASEANRITP